MGNAIDLNWGAPNLRPLTPEGFLDFECKKPGVGIDIKLRKHRDGLMWYTYLCFGNAGLVLFTDGCVYLPTDAQNKAADDQLRALNGKLRVKRKM